MASSYSEVRCIFDSPFGRIVVAATPKGISRLALRPTKREVKLAQDTASSESDALKALAHIRRLREQLTRYFAAEAVAFDVPLDLSGGTAFRRAIWRACARIPHGQTRSYAELARMAGRPAAVRAAGNALHNNPVPVVVPCHRVIRSDGALGGFGSGVSLKKKLLRLEEAVGRW